MGGGYLKDESAATGSVPGLRLLPPVFWEALAEGLTLRRVVSTSQRGNLEFQGSLRMWGASLGLWGSLGAVETG